MNSFGRVKNLPEGSAKRYEVQYSASMVYSFQLPVLIIWSLDRWHLHAPERGVRSTQKSCSVLCATFAKSSTSTHRVMVDLEITVRFSLQPAPRLRSDSFLWWLNDLPHRHVEHITQIYSILCSEILPLGPRLPSQWIKSTNLLRKKRACFMSAHRICELERLQQESPEIQGRC